MPRRCSDAARRGECTHMATTRERLRALVDTVPDRVLWGTDWPHPNVPVMPDDGDLVDIVPLYAPDPAIRQKLLVDNPARLFGFKD